MRITGVELRRVSMPLTSPFRTSFGTTTSRDVLLVRVVTETAEGWGECVADDSPLYSAEYVEGCADVLKRFLVPAVLAAGEVTTTSMGVAVAPFKGHKMAKAALETAILDAELRERGVSLGEHLGAQATRVPCGVSIGILDSVEELLQSVENYQEQGYRRIKLKIEPGWDVEPVAAVRHLFGDDLLLQVDANAAYTLADARQLRRLDAFDLVLLEQPLPAGDLRGHAQLARRLTTPLCLDESIESAAQAADALSIGACTIVNIKPGRVGGYLEARRIHDLCVAHQVPVWCGGMLETGVGRAANLALAALPGFVLPGDTSASDRYFAEDLTQNFVLEDGYLPVPTGPGVGFAPLPDRLAETTVSAEWLLTPGSAT